MAVYRLSKLVRMWREAWGMTQDELVEIFDGAETEDNEICSTDTLRRIERGKVIRVKGGVFKKIMRKLGVLPERVYASLFVTKSKALNLKAEIHVHICQGEYKKAEIKLKKLETMLMPDYPRNQQYLMERKATLSYRQGGLTADQYLGILMDALRLTVPVLDEIDIGGWAFNQNEFDILSGIGNAYSDMNNKDKEFGFLLELKKNVERKYMDRAHYVVWHMRALSGLSQLLSIEGEHEDALEYCKIGIEECKKWWILGRVYHFLYDIAWNKEQKIRDSFQVSKEFCEEQITFVKKERAFCKKQLVQAYYLSIAQGSLQEAERIKKLCEFFYPGEIKLL